MKHTIVHIFLLLLLVPSIGVGQEDDAVEKFFSDLAQRDAKQEKNLVLTNAKDYIDFWKDQEDFESLLKRENPSGYRIYLKEKAQAYYLHQLECNNQCDHNVYYLNKRDFYFLNGLEESEITLYRK